MAVRYPLSKEVLSKRLTTIPLEISSYMPGASPTLCFPTSSVGGSIMQIFSVHLFEGVTSQ